MMPIKILIVDDEPLAQEILQSYINATDGLELVGVCKNALEAFVMLNKQQIDVLLLDINMPEMSGIDFLKQLKNPPLTIFTTAYTEYAFQSYELNAIDYLLKPISANRFLKAIHKAQELLQPNSNTQEHIPVNQNQFFVRSNGKWIKIDVLNLWLIEGLKDYIRLWINDERITVHSTMKNFEAQLQSFPNFLRVHKSYIVNLNLVSEVDNYTLSIKDQRITIGSTYKEEVQKTLQLRKFF
jgi:DNA-binding LytR/AlgR family response regulator